MTPLRTFPIRSACIDLAALYRRVMVAHTATTLLGTSALRADSYATGCLSASAPDSCSPFAPSPLSSSAPSSSSPRPSDPLRVESDLPSLTPIPAHQQETILQLLTNPQFSLADIASIHSISIHDLCAWLTEPAVRERLRTLEETAAAHTRLVATLNLPKAVRAVTIILDEFANDADTRAHAARYASRVQRADASAPNADDPERASRLPLRRAQTAQRASWLLLRLARLTPVSDADLARARATLPASAPSKRTASVNERISSDSDDHATGCVVGGPTSAKDSNATSSHRTSIVNERIFSSDSSLPSQTMHPAGTLPNLPLASSLNDDANSPHGCAADGAAMPPDQIDAAPSPLPVPSPSAPTPLRPSAHAPLPPRPSVALRGPSM